MARSFTDKQFIDAIKNNITIAGALRALNLQPMGSNYKTVHNLVKKLKLDVSHWKGRGHLSGTDRTYIPKIPNDKLFVKSDIYRTTSAIKNRLIKERLIDYKCALCEITNWMNKHLSLHIDHINGDSTDNRLENLRFLCPNCHSQTSTYCGKNNKDNQQQKKCIECGIKIYKHSTRCSVCANKARLNKSKINWPPLDELIELTKQLGFAGAGRKLGVSDNAVRKRIARHS